MLKIKYLNDGANDVVQSWSIVSSVPTVVPANTLYVQENLIPVTLKVLSVNLNKFIVQAGNIVLKPGASLTGSVIISPNNSLPMSLERANKVSMFGLL